MTFAAPLPSIDISTNNDVCSEPVKAGREAGWDGDARRDQGGGRAEVVRLSESDSSLSSDEARLDAAAAHATLQEALACGAEPGSTGPSSPRRAQDVPKSVFSIIPRSGADKVLPRSRPAMPSLEDLEASPHYPVVVTPNPALEGYSFNGSADPRQQLDINGGVIEVDSAVFKGKLIVHMDNLPTTDASVFAGKKRLVHVAAQGKFKRRTRAAALCTGQEFAIALAANGTSVVWILEQVLRACAKVFSKTTIVDAHGERPAFYNPLIAACQLINVAREGEEPDMWTAKEDCRLLAPELSDEGRPVSADKRRKWCDDPENVEGLELDTDHVYTFHLWQHMMDFGTYRAHLGFMAIDLCLVVSSQPLQLFIKDVDTGDYGYSALVWHERLLYPDESAAKAREAAKSKGGISGRLRSLRLWS